MKPIDCIVTDAAISLETSDVGMGNMLSADISLQVYGEFSPEALSMLPGCLVQLSLKPDATEQQREAFKNVSEGGRAINFGDES